MVPTGEVFYELEQQIVAGTLPDVTSLDEFWFDRIHLDKPVGMYAATTTPAATMLKIDHHELPPDSSIGGGELEFTPTMLEAIQDTIQSVLISSPRSGYSDFNLDGDIDGLDFLAWQRGNSPIPLTSTDQAAWEQHCGGSNLSSETTKVCLSRAHCC